MKFQAIGHRSLTRALLLGLAAVVASCGMTTQKMDLSRDMIATPPHRMSRSEYPFDASGRYVDAWAAEGAGRYGRGMNTDRTEDGRYDVAEPERRPLPPPRATASTPPLAPPRQATAKARPPSTPNSGASTSASSTPPKKPQPATTATASSSTTSSSTTSSSTTSSATTKSAAAKPPPKKPVAKKSPSTHTVSKGDSLSTLSRRYGVSVQALKKANNLKTDRIIDGRKLVIPKK